MGPYQVVELAEKWKKSLNDILRMVLDKRLQWWVLKPSIVFSGQPQIEHYDLIEPDIAVFFLTRNDTHMEYCYSTGEPCKYYLGDFVVFPEEVTRVEAENPDLLKLITESELTEKQIAPKEEPIKGHKHIADYFGVTGRQAKNYSKTKGFPIHKTTTGRVYAYASELKVWKERRDKN